MESLPEYVIKTDPMRDDYENKIIQKENEKNSMPTLD